MYTRGRARAVDYTTEATVPAGGRDDVASSPPGGLRGKPAPAEADSLVSSPTFTGVTLCFAPKTILAVRPPATQGALLFGTMHACGETPAALHVEQPECLCRRQDCSERQLGQGQNSCPLRWSRSASLRPRVCFPDAGANGRFLPGHVSHRIFFWHVAEFSCACLPYATHTSLSELSPFAMYNNEETTQGSHLPAGSSDDSAANSADVTQAQLYWLQQSCPMNTRPADFLVDDRS